MSRFESANRPTLLIATDEFAGMAREAAEAQGRIGSRIVSVAHPIGGIEEHELRARAEAAIDAVLTCLAGP